MLLSFRLMGQIWLRKHLDPVAGPVRNCCPKMTDPDYAVLYLCKVFTREVYSYFSTERGDVCTLP